ncbi:MAG: glycosyltransferase [Burkholderiales bacterium]|nr:glycosyltransferase [Burkholderiales bacterium]
MDRICVVTTTTLIVDFFLGPQLRALAAAGHRVVLAYNRGEPAPDPARVGPVDCARFDLRREIAPLHDAAGLVQLLFYFLRQRPDGVVSVAPKAGLLAMIAARLAGVPLRCHIFQGEVWATRRGAMRRLLRTSDRITAALASHVLVVSASERDFLVREGIVSSGKATVLGSGSIRGVDTARFAPDPAARAQVRIEMAIPAGHRVILFLGRLKRDKGVVDLARAFALVAPARADWHLLLVGPDEDDLRTEVEAACGPDLRARLHIADLTPHPQRYVAAADILCLPSHREGFGNTILEAGAARLPVVASRIYGIEDAAVEGETALLHRPGDAVDLAARLGALMDDPALRERLGAAGQVRVLECFKEEDVVARYARYFSERLASGGGREHGPAT